MFCSVPQFELVWVKCWRNESIRGLWRCSFDAQEESFELGQHRSEPPVSCPSTLDMVINSTVSVVKKRDDMCCEQLKLLRPPNTRTLLPVCQGKLVIIAFYSKCAIPYICRHTLCAIVRINSHLFTPTVVQNL